MTGDSETKKSRQGGVYIRRILEKIFLEKYVPETKSIPFLRSELEESARELGLNVPKNLGDVVYSFRYRIGASSAFQERVPEDYEWTIQGAGRGAYCFVLSRLNRLEPRSDMVAIKIPDATPEIIGAFALGDEQALLAKVRYNRLIDVFLGLTAFSLQNHLRTAVSNVGQIEIDEIYVALDKTGAQYVVPVQAKGGSDKSGIVQTAQDIACCREKFPQLICRPVTVQFMGNDEIATFEMTEQEDEIKIVEEKHYRLTSADEISKDELASYGSRANKRPKNSVAGDHSRRQDHRRDRLGDSKSPARFVEIDVAQFDPREVESQVSRRAPARVAGTRRLTSTRFFGVVLSDVASKFEPAKPAKRGVVLKIVAIMRQTRRVAFGPNNNDDVETETSTRFARLPCERGAGKREFFAAPSVDGVERRIARIFASTRFDLDDRQFARFFVDKNQIDFASERFDAASDDVAIGIGAEIVERDPLPGEAENVLRIRRRAVKVFANIFESVAASTRTPEKTPPKRGAEGEKERVRPITKASDERGENEARRARDPRREPGRRRLRFFGRWERGVSNGLEPNQS